MKKRNLYFLLVVIIMVPFVHTAENADSQADKSKLDILQLVAASKTGRPDDKEIRDVIARLTIFGNNFNRRLDGLVAVLKKQ